VTARVFIVGAATLASVGTIPVAPSLILGIRRFHGSEARAPHNFIGNGVAPVVRLEMGKCAGSEDACASEQ